MVEHAKLHAGALGDVQPVEGLAGLDQAQQMEAAYLSALEKRDAEAYNLFKANQDLTLAQASVQLQVANNVRIDVSRAAIVGYQGQEPIGEALSQSKTE